MALSENGDINGMNSSREMWGENRCTRIILFITNAIENNQDSKEMGNQYTRLKINCMTAMLWP